MPTVKPLVGSNAGRWNVTVKIYAADGTTLATVYSDADGDNVGANPLPGQRNTGDFGVDNSGNWTCWVVPGDYQVGVRPHGGSETKTPVTVAADVADPTTVLGLVHGVRADGDVPVWNDARQRLEWTAPSAASGALVTVQASSADPNAVVIASASGLTGSPSDRNDGPVLSLALGPVKVGPGGRVVQFIYSAQGAAQLVNLNAQVVNADVTEGIYFYAGALPVELTVGAGYSNITSDMLDTAPTLVGTDLSVDSIGRIHSAAGGIFWVVANFYVRPA